MRERIWVRKEICQGSCVGLRYLIRGEGFCSLLRMSIWHGQPCCVPAQACICANLHISPPGHPNNFDRSPANLQSPTHQKDWEALKEIVQQQVRAPATDGNTRAAGSASQARTRCLLCRTVRAGGRQCWSDRLASNTTEFEEVSRWQLRFLNSCLVSRVRKLELWVPSFLSGNVSFGMLIRALTTTTEHARAKTLSSGENLKRN